jgi:cob(I)alamin adenosyltransferase
MSYFSGNEHVMTQRTSIYTGYGDQGYTSLRDNTISKDELLVEAVGSIDELNSYVGLIAVLSASHLHIHHALIQIQNHLLDLGGELHQPQTIRISEQQVSWLEQRIDEWQLSLPVLSEFILPGGTPPAACAHIARSVCRRAERALVKCHRQIPLNNPEQLRYLNRLSDLLFVAARVLTHESHTPEQRWEKGPAS